MKREAVKAMGTRLQELRQAAKLSQSQLARAAGIPASSLRNYEQGQRVPRIDAAYRLAHALQITVDELIGEVFVEKPASKGKAGTRGGRKGKEKL